ncbi:MAG: ornithine carbamoyltransferase, partial [Rhodospirillaceae bacterium]|nr:ornithine carbamoyltransferase [Rhodospirillaceae bacterium]
MDSLKSRPKHFLDLAPLDASTLRKIISLGQSFKSGAADEMKPLTDKYLAMVFQKPSTRTRVSFDVAMRQLGGEVVNLSSSEMQTGRGESLADTARVLSRYVDAIMIRTAEAENLRELSDHATVPVINGLTDDSHPCQLMADVMTYEEHRGPIADGTIAWSGDGNNMATSWIQAAVRFGFELRLACPPELNPPPETMAWAKAEGGRINLTADPGEAVDGADCVVTDTWVSMNDAEAETRHNLLRAYQVDDR